MVIVNVSDAPLQPFKFGVTVMLAITGLVPLLIAVKGEISPTPFAPNPIVGSLFVQLYVVFGIAPEKITSVVCCPLQTV